MTNDLVTGSNTYRSSRALKNLSGVACSGGDDDDTDAASDEKHGKECVWAARFTLSYTLAACAQLV